MLLLPLSPTREKKKNGLSFFPFLTTATKKKKKRRQTKKKRAKREEKITGRKKKKKTKKKKNSEDKLDREELIEKSKFLGGDLDHTHLVIGLDVALRDKTLQEIEEQKAEEQHQQQQQQLLKSLNVSSASPKQEFQPKSK